MRPDVTDHVDDEVLARYATNELRAQESEAVRAHLSMCEECASVWQAVQAMSAAAAEFDPAARRPVSPLRARRRRRTVAWGLAAAASLLLAIVALPRWLDRPTPAADIEVVRSGERLGPQPLTPAEASHSDAPVFSWSSVDEAVGYSLDLLDADGSVLWVSDRVVGTTASWPAAVECQPGAYYWRVSAHFEDGEETVASPLVSFEVDG